LSTIEGNSLDLSLDFPENQLASLLGTIPETLSRIIKRMTREGLIRTEGFRICIQDLLPAVKTLSGETESWRMTGCREAVCYRIQAYPFKTLIAK
jgi:DNA-binding Lrp family transcriptional regulator